MLRTIRKDDPELVRTLIALRRAAREHQAPVWGTVAEKLARPRHQTRPVNVGRLARVAPPKSTVVVPGKLLAAGDIESPITVAAFDFSDAARAKIRAAGGTTLTIPELVQAHPDGAGVRIYA